MNIEVGFLGEKLATAGQGALVFTLWFLAQVLGSVWRACR
jgi:ABC-type transport system involved in multi-copper enzyme maturation permease subunit